MKFATKNNAKKVLFLLIILSFFLFSNISAAKANVFSDLENGVATFVHFVVQSFKGFKNNQIASSTNESTSSTGNIFSIFSMPGFLVADLNNLTSSIASGTAYSFPVDFSSDDNPYMSTTSGNISIATTTTQTETQSTTTLPGGLSGSTDQNGVSLNNSQIIYWTNIERNNNGGLSALSENNTLDRIATIRIEDMFAKQYFDHYSPTGDNVSLEANANSYQYITIGENIAEGNFGSSRDLVDAWMNSPGHRANILNSSYTEIGVAAEQGNFQGSEVWIASQVFGEPLSKCPSPDASLKQKISNSAGMTNTEIQALVKEYNQQVATFNACIK